MSSKKDKSKKEAPKPDTTKRTFERVIVGWMVFLTVAVVSMLWGWGEFSQKLRDSEAIMKTVELKRLHEANQKHSVDILDLHQRFTGHYHTKK
jgi:hypothetical protein